MTHAAIELFSRARLGFVRAAVCCLVAAWGASLAFAAGPTGVPTFESIGIYWSPSGGAENVPVAVRYRVADTSGFKNALDLWFDAGGGEYRGSIVNLKPATTYDIELTKEGSSPVLFQVKTWNENFKIAKTVNQIGSVSNGTYNGTFNVPEGGSAASGYVLYTPAAGKSITIDPGGNTNAVVISKPFVILRGFKVVGGANGGSESAIKITASDVVVEQNDISAYGTMDAPANEWQAGIRSSGSVSRLIIQRNRFHDPNFGSTSWCNSGYPNGQHAIRLKASAGNHVIRYNELLWSKTGEYAFWADGISIDNFASQDGGDNDIYGNYIERSTDNGLEIEGGNRNTRIWGNLLDGGYRDIAITPSALGPLYIWRNVVRKSQVSASASCNSPAAFKAGGGSPGRVYIFHNTLVQPNGVDDGFVGSASGGGAYNNKSANNILQTTSSGGKSVNLSSSTTGYNGNDFDYDLYNGALSGTGAHETHGIKGSPQYASSNGPDAYFLSSGSPGANKGKVIPNFNDGYGGGAPDMGAFEIGAPALEFGIDAYTTKTDLDGDGVSPPADCNDGNPAVYEGAAEICGDGIDQDCDGVDASCDPPPPPSQPTVS